MSKEKLVERFKPMDSDVNNLVNLLKIGRKWNGNLSPATIKNKPWYTRFYRSLNK